MASSLRFNAQNPDVRSGFGPAAHPGRGRLKLRAPRARPAANAGHCVEAHQPVLDGARGDGTRQGDQGLGRVLIRHRDVRGKDGQGRRAGDILAGRARIGSTMCPRPDWHLT